MSETNNTGSPFENDEFVIFKNGEITTVYDLLQLEYFNETMAHSFSNPVLYMHGAVEAHNEAITMLGRLGYDLK